MRTVLYTAPTVEPLTAEEVIEYGRLPASTPQIGLINDCIVRARQAAEHWTGMQMLSATRKAYLDRFPAQIRPEFPPLITVSSITYVDTDGTTQTWSSSEYTVVTTHYPAIIEPAYGYTWPSHRYVTDAICVTYTCGYGTAATSVPADLRQVIAAAAAFWFDNRLADLPESIMNQLVKHWHGYSWND